MNKTAIKNFAIWARNKLIADIQYRAGLMGITADGIKSALPQSTKETEFYDIGIAEPYSITGEAIGQRRSLVNVIEQKTHETNYKTAYKYIIEGVAYTWFNRLIAIRFMEINDYLPSHIRVLSSDSGKMEPDLVTTPFDAELNFTDKEKEEIIRLKNENDLDEVFRRLFIKQCNALNELLPALFEKTADYTELLLNISAVDKEGVVYHLVNDISEDDFNIEKGGQVEIIGWLFQYYNTEPKSDAFAKKGRITREEVPAVTQLFTPDWIVRYMVENSLGRMWLKGHPNDLLRSKWKYYLEDAEQEPEAQLQVDELYKDYTKLNPEDIHFIDPCMGSGHILVYAFEVLMQIYESVGYSKRDAAKSILDNNLYGIDIDDRAYQMAYFAVMMKARQYNRRILSADTPCHVYSIQESNSINRNQLVFFGACLVENEKNEALKQINDLLDVFRDAKEYGSILNVKNYDWDLLRRFTFSTNNDGQITIDSVGLELTKEKITHFISVGETLERKYEVVVTNPPYMADTGMDKNLTDYVRKYYPECKADLYAVFMQCCQRLSKRGYYYALITQHSWMFISSFESLRNTMQEVDMVSMLHLGSRAFDEISGEVVQTTSFVVCNTKINKCRGTYIRLVDSTSQHEKEKDFLKREKMYIATQSDFKNVPGGPFVYWISDNILCSFKKPNISDISEAKAGIVSGNDSLFMKLWYEVDCKKITFNATDFNDKTAYKWVPINKGGTFRRYYGNKDFVINIYDLWNSEEKSNVSIRRSDPDYYFRSALTWSYVNTGKTSFRYIVNSTSATAAPTLFFSKENDLFVILALLNSNIAQEYLNLLNPTINLNVTNVSNIPLLIEENYDIDTIVESCKDNISIAKKDWDSFENSWDFKKHPLI